MKKPSDTNAHAATANTPVQTATAEEKQAAAPAQASAKNDNMLSLALHFPEGATAKLDGGSISNPFKATVPKDGTLHQLEVTQDGYDIDKRTLNFGQDIDITVMLQKSKDPKKPRVIISTPVAVAAPVKTPDPPQTAAPPPPATDDTPHARPKPTGDIDDSNPWKK